MISKAYLKYVCPETRDLGWVCSDLRSEVDLCPVLEVY